MDLPVNKIICGAMPGATKIFPDGYFNCSISSPPYWALRDYGVDGQLGLEPTFEEYIDKLCGIYDEVKRVLRPDGTCWVNLGDTYGTHTSKRSGNLTYEIDSPANKLFTQNRLPQSVPEKSLCLIPQRFAIEMVNRGWILRNVIIWYKPNPMPSSAKDRFTVDFEYVYFFIKNNQILWHFRPDGKVSDRPPAYKKGIEGLDWYWGKRKGKRVKKSLWQGFKYWFEPQYEPYLTESNAERPRMGQGNRTKYNQKRSGVGWGNTRTNNPSDKRDDAGTRIKKETENPLGRNKRTVWTIPTQPCPEAHFATYPEKLVEPMIKAGCPEFICTKCGKARVKIYAKTGGTTGKSWHPHKNDIAEGNVKQQTGSEFETYKVEFKGYTDCGCGKEFRPGIVLDCFCRCRDNAKSGRPIAA